MTSADSNAELVENGAHIVRVNVAHKEGDAAALVLRLAKDAHTLNQFQLLRGIRYKVVLVCGDVVDTDRADKPQSLLPNAVEPMKSGVPASNLKGSLA